MVTAPAPHAGSGAPCADCATTSSATLWSRVGRMRLCGRCAADRMLRGKREDTCCLCGGSPYVVGVFRPDEPRLYGARHGGSRLLRYALCRECFELPRAVRHERVEALLAASFGAEGHA